MGTARNEVAGLIYQCVARGVDRRRIFVDEADFRKYIALLAAVVQRQGWKLYCFCLMPNHVHLLIQTVDANMGNGMQWLQSRYALYFNERHARAGHLFETTYKSSALTTDGAFINMVGYIVVNPVDAALCRHAEEWPWGSHAIVTDPFAPAAPWLAHRELVFQLDGMTGVRGAYSELVAAHEVRFVDAIPRSARSGFVWGVSNAA